MIRQGLVDFLRKRRKEIREILKDGIIIDINTIVVPK